MKVVRVPLFFVIHKSILIKIRQEFVNYLSESVEMVACYFKELLRFHFTWLKIIWI